MVFAVCGQGCVRSSSDSSSEPRVCAAARSFPLFYRVSRTVMDPRAALASWSLCKMITRRKSDMSSLESYASELTRERHASILRIIIDTPPLERAEQVRQALRKPCCNVSPLMGPILIWAHAFLQPTLPPGRSWTSGTHRVVGGRDGPSFSLHFCVVPYRSRCGGSKRFSFSQWRGREPHMPSPAAATVEGRGPRRDPSSPRRALPRQRGALALLASHAYEAEDPARRARS
jgi:hypothetical protein